MTARSYSFIFKITRMSLEEKRIEPDDDLDMLDAEEDGHGEGDDDEEDARVRE